MKRCMVAFLCVALVLGNCVLFPLRARATMTGTLMVVSAGAVVTAALMASGIYPYEQQKQFVEYVSDNLSALWSQYLDWRQNNIGSVPESGRELSSLTGWLSGQTVILSRKIWNTLAEFVSWVKDTFSVTDSQEDVVLGTINSFPLLPYGYGTLLDVGGGKALGSIPAGLRVCYQLQSDGNYRCWCGSGWRANDNAAQITVKIPGSTSYWSSVNTTYGGYDVALLLSGPNWRNPALVVTNEERNISIPVFDNAADVGAYISGAVTMSPPVVGVVADTAIVSPLEALPDDVPFAGLSVPEAGVMPTVDTLESVIETGVTDRVKPIVRPVEVEIGEGVNVDADTGTITATDDSIVITPQDIPFMVSDYQIAGLSSVFPFSIPWDIARVFQAFDAAPRCPLDDWSVTLPFGGLGLWSASENPTVSFNLSQFPEVRQKIDQIAVVCRSFLLVLACVLWLVFLAKFVRF